MYQTRYKIVGFTATFNSDYGEDPIVHSFGATDGLDGSTSHPVPIEYHIFKIYFCTDSVRGEWNGIRIVYIFEEIDTLYIEPEEADCDWDQVVIEHYLIGFTARLDSNDSISSLGVITDSSSCERAGNSYVNTASVSVLEVLEINIIFDTIFDERCPMTLTWDLPNSFISKRNGDTNPIEQYLVIAPTHSSEAGNIYLTYTVTPSAYLNILGTYEQTFKI